MAAGGERRMVFDIRGRRKHVVRVVYAILALLMGASLFLVVGPVNIGSLLGNATTSSNAAGLFEEQAERVEHRLRKSPEDPNLLVALTRARINAGGAKSEPDPTTGVPKITPEGKAEFEKALGAWDRYLKQAGGEVSPTLALLVAKTFYGLALNSRSYEEAFENLDGAAAAQRHITEAKPTLNALTSLAIYEFLGGNFAEAEKVTKQAEALATSKSQEKAIAKQAAVYLKQGKEIQKQKKKFEKAEKGKGKEALEHPLGGLGGSSSLTP
jgi:tetratricopeptide (TPR) repeat protein